MQALPTAPMATPRRQVFVGTALALGAAATALGAMLAMWLRYRDAAISVPGGSWLPKDVSVPMVPANVMLIACLPICIFAQWAVYSAKRQDKPHAGLALGLVALLAIAVINAQAYIYSQMAVPVNEGAYGAMFYAATGTVVAFRYLGGRTTDVEVVSAHALYWYVFSAAYAVLWFVIYVTK